MKQACLPQKGEAMSFSGNLKEEIARIIPSGKRARETAAAALLVNIGSFSRTREGEILLTISAGNETALRKYFALTKCFTLIQKNGNINFVFSAPQISNRNTEDSFLREESGPKKNRPWEGGIKGSRKTIRGQAGSDPGLCFPQSGEEARETGRFPLLLPQVVAELAGRMQIMAGDGTLRQNDGTLPASFVEGIRGRDYLREMFLCTGFMSDPRKRYHMEFRCFSQAQADQLREVLGDQGVHAGLTIRKKYFVVYLKDSEDIAGLLQLMGASVSLMAMENARIFKEVRNNVKRRVNCETANIGKTVESAARQLEDIRLLREKGILEELPAQIREAAALREEHPGASLSELGELADPPVGRSGMNHRMRKLTSLAQKIQQVQ